MFFCMLLKSLGCSWEHVEGGSAKGDLSAVNKPLDHGRPVCCQQARNGKIKNQNNNAF